MKISKVTDYAALNVYIAKPGQIISLCISSPELKAHVCANSIPMTSPSLRNHPSTIPNISAVDWCISKVDLYVRQGSSYVIASIFPQKSKRKF